MTVFPRDLVPRILLSLSFIGRERNQITCSQGVSHPLGNNCLRLQHPRVIKCRISILESLKILLSYPFKQILQISRFLIALHFGFGIHVQGGDLRAKDEGRRDLQLVQQRISSSTKGIEDVQYIHDQTAPPHQNSKHHRVIVFLPWREDAEKEDGRTEIHQHGRYTLYVQCAASPGSRKFTAI